MFGPPFVWWSWVQQEKYLNSHTPFQHLLLRVAAPKQEMEKHLFRISCNARPSHLGIASPIALEQSLSPDLKKQPNHGDAFSFFSFYVFHARTQTPGEKEDDESMRRNRFSLQIQHPTLKFYSSSCMPKLKERNQNEKLTGSKL